MLSRHFGMAIGATLLVAASLCSVQSSLCKAIASDSRALYLFAEYKMLTGDKESAVKLLQQASIQKEKPSAETNVRHGACSEAGPGAMVVMY